MNDLQVLAVGPLVTVQDLGRPGWWAAGIGVAGAADRGSLRLANRLVGNAESAAGLEVLLGGLQLRALRRATLAVTGAPAQATVNGTPVGHASVVELAAGDLLRLADTRVGLRSYLGIRGGVEVPAVLGSRSRDTLGGIGPEPLAAGDLLPIGPAPQRLPNVAVAPMSAMTDEPIEVQVLLGPRADWFESATALFEGHWTVTPQADRAGVRLTRKTGPPLRRRQTGELPTEGMVTGAIQVPPNGEPMVFLADHPITGGYPVIGCVIRAQVDRVAQARPGQSIRFRPARR